MRITIVTDVWRPQVNGVVTTLTELARGVAEAGHGLVMREAMAYGTPVAAFPLAGPSELLGNSGAGVLHPDLRTAALRALDVPRERALARAREFDWADTTRQFLGHLVPVQPERVMPLSQQIHKLVP